LLARNAKILESVVSMASCQASTAPSSTAQETRKVAMAILLRFSENPCLQRVLARHPGLLSSMIYFVRQFPHEDETSASDDLSSVSLLRPPQDIKNQILLLAKAL